jgi:hypothetical protein
MRRDLEAMDLLEIGMGLGVQAVAEQVIDPGAAELSRWRKRGQRTITPTIEPRTLIPLDAAEHRRPRWRF